MGGGGGGGEGVITELKNVNAHPSHFTSFFLNLDLSISHILSQMCQNERKKELQSLLLLCIFSCFMCLTMKTIYHNAIHSIWRGLSL